MDSNVHSTDGISHEPTKTKNIVITGSASGLGREIYYQMLDSPYLTPIGVDQNAHEYTDYGMDIRDALHGMLRIRLEEEYGEIYGLINCAGVNYINNMDEIEMTEWNKVMDINTKSIWTMSVELMPLLEKTRGVILNIVSNAAHMPMTHSIAYNASKAAAYIMTKQMARELTKARGITVFSASPNKLENTGMSKYIEKRVLELRPDMTAAQAKQYQLNALPSGFETDPSDVAELIVWLFEHKRRHKYLAGCDLQLGA